jgi:hypothetical protein
VKARTVLILSGVGLTFTLSGCITEKAVLANAQGQTITCESKGHVGLVSPIRVYVKRHNCIKSAEAGGYKVPPSASAASAPPTDATS